MRIIMNAMEEPREAYCDDCNRWAKWWHKGISTRKHSAVFFACDRHAKAIEKQAKASKVSVLWYK